MTIWKNTCGESWQDTIENGWEGSGKPGAFLFFIPKGALTHHLRKQEVVALPLVGHVRSPRGIAPPAGAAGRCHSPVGSAVIVHAVIASTPNFASVSRGTVCTPALRQLPAKTCHRQLCRKYGYRFSGDTHFLFAKKKQKRREGENEWQSTIWKQK